VRHWAGEFSLARSVWLNTVLPCLAVPLLGAALLPFLGERFPARYLSGALFVLLLVGYVVVAWSVIGTARSARRHADRGGQRWEAWAVLGLLLLALLKLSHDSGGAVPLLREHWKVATGAQPGPEPEITLRADGRSLLFAGSFNDGATDSLQRALEASPQVQTVVLRSPGGWIREGERMAELIGRLGLDTAVEAYCESACTVALVAGRERVATPQARIGFHGGRAVGVGADPLDNIEVTNRLLAAYRAAGLPEEFLAEVASVPHHRVWYPTHEELLAHGVLSGTDRAAPDLSWLHAVKSREELVRRYLGVEPLMLLAERFPADFERLTDSTWLLIQAGAGQRIVEAALRAQLAWAANQVRAGGQR
jgi:hypothetical protein